MIEIVHLFETSSICIYVNSEIPRSFPYKKEICTEKYKHIALTYLKRLSKYTTENEETLFSQK